MAGLDTKTETDNILDENIEAPEEDQINSNLKPEESSDTTLPVKADAALVPVNPENTDIDEALVKEACEEITSIFSKHIETAIRETGGYLIRKFFDDDYEKAREKKKEASSPKGSSLRQVFMNFKESGAGKPSQSWLYQAIDYVIQEKDLENELGHGKNEAVLGKFNKLLVSHKVTLLSVKDVQNKIKIIEDADPDNITVKQLKDIIVEKGFRPQRSIGILTIVKNPTAYEEIWEEKFNEDALKKLDHETLLKLPKLIEKRRKAYQEEMENMNKNITKYNVLEDILPSIISAKEKKERKQKNSKP